MKPEERGIYNGEFQGPSEGYSKEGQQKDAERLEQTGLLEYKFWVILLSTSTHTMESWIN